MLMTSANKPVIAGAVSNFDEISIHLKYQGADNVPS
jgi:hypothetical protein